MNKSQIITSIVLLLFFLVGYNSIFTVREDQQVIITQFGKPIGEPVTEAGLNFKMPFLQETRYFDKRILSWDGEPNEIPTNDKTFIWVDTAARWRIVQPLTFYQRMGSEARALQILSENIDGAVRDLVTKNDLSEIILSSDWKKEYSINTESTKEVVRDVKVGRDKYSEIIRENLRSVVQDYGIEIIDIFIKRINYTDQVREKVYERMISERKRIAAKKRSEGEGEKAQILGQLEKELSQIQSDALRTAREIKGEADGEAAKIFGESYGADAEFYAFYQTLQTYKDIVKNNTKLIISTDSDLYSYLKSTK